MDKKVIFVCSPFGGKEENLSIAKDICRQIMVNCEKHVPIAPHLFFPQFLDESSAIERTFGIVSGIEFLKRSDEIWVFAFDGISKGMQIEIEEAQLLGKPVHYFYRWPLDPSFFNFTEE